MELQEGNVFTGVCLSTGNSPMSFPGGISGRRSILGVEYVHGVRMFIRGGYVQGVGMSWGICYILGMGMSRGGYLSQK